MHIYAWIYMHIHVYIYIYTCMDICQGIIQEFHIWASVLTWASPCDEIFATGVYETLFLLTIYSNFSGFHFSVNVLLPYSSYCFPYFYRMKTVCSCWVWKLSKDACPINLVSSASFLTQSDWLKKKASQSLCVRKTALGTKLMPTKTMVRH